MKFQQLDNKTPDDMEPYIAELFENAQTSLFISSKFQPEFYNRPKIKTALEKCLNRVEICRILVDSDVDWANRQEHLPWLNEAIMAKGFPVRKSKRAILHWIIIDDKSVRLEKPHHQELVTSNQIIQNIDKPVLDMIKDAFNSWWINAVVVQSNRSNHP